MGERSGGREVEDDGRWKTCLTCGTRQSATGREREMWAAGSRWAGRKYALQSKKIKRKGGEGFAGSAVIEVEVSRGEKRK
jgi:hypothetical protein